MQKKLYKLVLTGGPCGGKTTALARLSSFFESHGWKVYRVPETATVLLSGGVKFCDLTPQQAYDFQDSLLKTMLQIEDTFFKLAESHPGNCLVICDRGAMDVSAFLQTHEWKAMLDSYCYSSAELREERYHHVVHLVTAAIGAEKFYSSETNACRSENLDLARDIDFKVASAWVDHPCFDVIDNSGDFEEKICRLIQCVSERIGIDTTNRLLPATRKVKFLVG